ncbi:MAG TPA: UDP-N-acetylglucosamine 2-epimerase (non-hydrolyzing) [Dehalococcoidia bacterium]|nr:UDP-N-acetylglucosamine 2-epimerase (non-hydrolyzing) [Dehalococcoidia bacterium]
MKLLTVVGARPQFIKAAAFSRVARERHTEILVHTGQHYDAQMSDVFFDELALPRPDHHLGVGSGPHGAQTAQMLERLEVVIQREAPDRVVIFGDTNSTLAGALAAAKLGVPVAHVEAGLRSYVRDMPEEINRVVADRLSRYLFAPTPTAVDNLAREGITEGVSLTGDIMYDALLQHAMAATDRASVLRDLCVEPGGYVLATVHRAANTDDPARLAEILDALTLLREPVILPLHPRTRAALMATDIEVEPPVRLIEPVGYLEMLMLEGNARMVLTDSGGVQKEAYLLQVPCVTLREETEWVETLDGGWNVLAGTDAERILAAARRPRPAGEPPPVFGNGDAAERMVEALES